MIQPFFDTSILLGGLIETKNARPACLSIYDAIAEGRWPHASTAWHCCLEFYSVSTRLPDEYRLSPTTASKLVETEILARLKIGDLPPSARSDFVSSLSKGNLGGGRAYDAHIAAVAISIGADILVTENKKHFATLPHLTARVLNAAEFLQEAT